MVTDPLTFPAMTMWFMMNPARPASVHVTSTEEFDFLPVDFHSSQLQPGVHGRFYSPLSHLRFYLPQVFPFLRKVLLVDHDVVVRKDLTPLWRVDLKEKVNGAVETPLRLESFVDFSDPALAGQFDPKTTAWAFGMNIFDLDKWRQRGLTEVYQKFLQQVSSPLFLSPLFHLHSPLSYAEEAGIEGGNTPSWAVDFLQRDTIIAAAVALGRARPGTRRRFKGRCGRCLRHPL